MEISNPGDWTIWFDLDDTLWDFHANSFKTLSEVYTFFKLDEYWDNVDDWKKDYHAVNDPLWVLLSNNQIDAQELRFRRFYDTFVNQGMDKAEAAQLAPIADKFYLSKLSEKELLIPGAYGLLSNLKKKGFKTGILSNGFSDAQYNKMRSGKIDHLIDFVVLSDHINVQKPHTDLFEYAEKVCSCPPQNCIMVGDNSYSDIYGALQAGWALAIWYNPTDASPCEQIKSGFKGSKAYAVIGSLSDIKL